MELVYLWVEKYKNIEKEGFNFSPMFECKYDEDMNELIINKNDDYVSIFPKNINITAIVGENGSGKSNAFEALLSNFMSNSVPIDEPFKVMSIFYNSVDEKIYYKDLGGCTIEINKDYLYENIDALLKYKISNIKDTGVFTFHYNYGLDWIYNNENNLNFNKLFHKTDNYNTPILLQPNKANNQIQISNIDYLAMRDILNFTIHKNVSFDFINDFFTPTKCKLKIDTHNIIKFKNNDKSFIEASTVSIKLEEIQNSRMDFKDKLIKYSYLYIIRKTLNNKDTIKNLDLKEKIDKFSNLRKQVEELVEYIKDKEYDNLYEEKYFYKVNKIKQTFLFVEYLQTLDEIDSFLFSSLNTLIIEENKELLVNLAPWIEIEFLNDDDVSFYSLSYGQKFLVKFIYSLLSQLYNLTSHKEYKNIILLLDEVELGLHPNWQKKYLSILMSVLNTKIEGFDFNYNIICSTHSPFILSDLPKENVIFLEKGEQKDPFKDSQTFGANIHTLLSHGFFMKDGLMGEFAKEKINDVIKILQKEKLSQDEIKTCKHIISIIGEPILQKTLEHQLNKKLNPNETELQKLEKEKEEIEKRISKLQGNSNEKS